MTVEIEFQRTKLDENFDEMKTILASHGVILEMAMTKLLELKVQGNISQEAETDS